jgi:hypothetical protein
MENGECDWWHISVAEVNLEFGAGGGRFEHV